MKVLLTQPNYISLGKRTYKAYPYGLGIINACINKKHESDIFDPNINLLSDEEIINYFKEYKADLVGVSTISTEYFKTTIHITDLIRKASPNTIIVVGGTIPTVSMDISSRDNNVDYWIIGEGEITFLELLDELEKDNPDISSINGLAYRDKDKIIINEKREFIEDLDSIPFPDYGSINISDYSYQTIKLGAQVRPRRNPYAYTSTSRGCCYSCIFCSGPVVSGKKVRMRSANNVLKEIDELYESGIKEIIFTDDHFLFDRKRAISIMEGLIDRNYDLSWKCFNITIWLADEKIIKLMKESGCYQVTSSIESGSEHVLKNIIKKPVNLIKIKESFKLLRKYDMEIITNWVIGFPGETWDQIRETFKYADALDIDLHSIHIATPLPNTRLREICIERGLLPKDYDDTENVGYSKGVITTDEFTPPELQIIRAFEWDRLNFSTKEKREKLADMYGITLDELNEWRQTTRRNLGIPNKEWGMI